MIRRLDFVRKRFSTDSQRNLSGAGWILISQLAGILVRLGSNLALTRLLAPEAFGLVGTALTFLTTLEWLSDLGVQPALMRHPRGDDQTVLSTGWWINLCRGFIVTGVAIAAAWPISQFFNQPQLAPVLAVLALRPALMSLRSPGLPRLRRAMDFRSVFIDEFTMTVTGTLASVLVAMVFPSVWAIVLGTLTGAASGIVISFVICPERPVRPDRQVGGELRRFSTQILINTLLMALWMNIDRLLGLRLVSSHDMGIYTVAWNLAAVADSLISRFCEVHFASLSRLTDERQRQVAHERLMNLISLWIIPVAALAVCAGPWLVQQLYDARYAGVRILFPVLLCRALIRGVGQMQFQLLLARDQVRTGSLAYLMALALHAACVVPMTQSWGVSGLALSTLLSTTCVTVSQALLAARTSGDSLIPVFRTLAWINIPLLFISLLQAR
jgi:O-antigen/teichoic acid export membrane protein